MSYNLTAGIIEINEQDKSKSSRMLYPLAQLALDKEGQLQLDPNQTLGDYLTLSTGRDSQ